MSSSDASFRADAIDHLAEPTSPTAAERRGLTLALIAAAALHLLIPLAILIFALFSPRPSPPIEEIPVEVVVEQPPPPPKPPEAKPKPPPQPEDERPAYDAPSAATQEKANRESRDTKTSAPATMAEKSPNLGAPEESKEPAAAEARKAQAAPIPQQTPPAESADALAALSPAAKEAEVSPSAPAPAEKPSPPPAPRAKSPPGVPLPTAEVLPNYQFAHAATESPIVVGNAETRYFTIVYGMIRAHLHEPRNAYPATHGGAIVFALDETGNLLQRKIVSSSGSPNLDLAVMNAIAEAAPYPAPPGWQPKALRLTYGR
jgi:periplasmic protein TonB